MTSNLYVKILASHIKNMYTGNTKKGRCLRICPYKPDSMTERN